MTGPQMEVTNTTADPGRISLRKDLTVQRCAIRLTESMESRTSSSVSSSLPGAQPPAVMAKPSTRPSSLSAASAAASAPSGLERSNAPVLIPSAARGSRCSRRLATA